MDNALLAHLDAELVYLLLSAIVAIIIGYEGFLVRKSNGKIPKSRLFYISSVIDTLWGFVSIAAVYLIPLKSLALAVPAAYGIYTIVGWIYGSRLIRQNGVPDHPKDLIIPIKYIAFSQSFALIFFCLCLWVTFSLVLLPQY